MRFTTKTEYGLVALLYMTRHARERGVFTVKEIVQNERFSMAYIQQIFHILCDANIVRAHHGRQGGYSLARPASQITLKEIVEALEGGTFEVFCEPDVRREIVCTHFQMCGVKPIWQRTKNLLDDFLSSVTLEMLTGEESAVRMSLSRLPSTTPSAATAQRIGQTASLPAAGGKT